ncbi:MAG: class I SAM-dependent methyltransferase [Firmicutes bacterium]|nr:class I SAM-dependent methyltransferase [Bacillota bacterium]
MSKDNKVQWDASAKDYQNVYKLGLSEYNVSLIKYWEEKGLLRPGIRIIDIGCGVGRYGTYFAEIGCDVTLIDISSEMLKFAAENMAPYKTPWKVYECNFGCMTGDEEVFNGGFDLSISTMSPAIQTEEDIKRMAKITHGWCFISTFCEWKQPYRSKMLLETGIMDEDGLSDFTEKGGLHMIEMVRSLDFEPVVEYAPYCWSDERTPEEMACYMVRHFFFEDEDKDEKYKKLLDYSKAAAGEKGTVSDKVETKVAWISWKTN